MEVIFDMKVNFKRFFRGMIAMLSIFTVMIASIPVYANEETLNVDFCSRYVTVNDQKMHVVLYGDINQTGDEVSFSNPEKPTLVMLPGLGEVSPHLSFRPLAQQLDSSFNVVIVEPFGYGLSDLATTTRSVENINSDLNQALEALNIEECILAVHSISGVYGLNFVYEYPEKVKGFISIDNTIYDEAIQDELEMEQAYMLDAIESFDSLRNSFPSIQDFQLALSENPAEYGATLPEIIGYTYPESDMEEYIQAYSLSSNTTIKDEINQMGQSLLTIKDKKFPDSLPVLALLSADNVQNMPAWETGHRNQLNFESGNHELYILNGSHYIWHTNLSGIIDHIEDWQASHNF